MLIIIPRIAVVPGRPGKWGAPWELEIEKGRKRKKEFVPILKASDADSESQLAYLTQTKLLT